MENIRGSHVCTTCNSIVIPKNKQPSSFIVELMVWIVALFFAPFSFGFSLALAFGFSLYRMFNKKKVCPECDSDNIVPINTPVAKKIISERGLKES